MFFFSSEVVNLLGSPTKDFSTDTWEVVVMGKDRLECHNLTLEAPLTEEPSPTAMYHLPLIANACLSFWL